MALNKGNFGAVSMGRDAHLMPGFCQKIIILWATLFGAWFVTSGAVGSMVGGNYSSIESNSNPARAGIVGGRSSKSLLDYRWRRRKESWVGSYAPRVRRRGAERVCRNLHLSPVGCGLNQAVRYPKEFPRDLGQKAAALRVSTLWKFSKDLGKCCNFAPPVTITGFVE